MDVTGTDAVHVDAAEDIATIRFDRPDSLNAANADLIEGFNAALSYLRENPEPGLLLTGEGRATHAGLDREIAEAGYPEAFPELEAMVEENYALLEGYPYPTAMACRGAVVGMGLGISLRCDFAVAGEETRLSMPEVAYAIPPISFPRLQELVGSRIAKEIALTTDPIAPERAFDLGLLNRVVPEEEVEDETRELLSRTVEHDPGIVAEVIETSGALLAGNDG